MTDERYHYSAEHIGTKDAWSTFLKALSATNEEIDRQPTPELQLRAADGAEKNLHFQILFSCRNRAQLIRRRPATHPRRIVNLTSQRRPGTRPAEDMPGLAKSPRSATLQSW
jgi:hypothetical protein